MDADHTEGLVERTVAYVKDALGLTPENKTPDQSSPVAPGAVPKVAPDAEDVMTGYPRMGAPKTALELDAESARSEDGG